MEYIVMVLLAIIAFVLLHFYYKKKYGHWESQNVPHLKTRFFVGSYKLNDKPLHELERELYKQYGRLYGRYDGEIPVLCVAQPDLLKRIFVKDFHLFMNRRDIKFNDPVMDNTLFALEGEDWRRVRSHVSPTLTSAKLKRMLPLMDDCADVLVKNISKIVENSKKLDCQRAFGAFTIDTIARCAFGMTINSLLTENDPFVEKAKRLLDCCLGWRTILTILCPRVMKWFRISLLNPETTKFYKDTVLQIVKERKKNRGREDFLQLLLDLQNDSQDQNNNSVRSKCYDSSPNPNPGPETSNLDYKSSFKGLSHEEFIAQCVTFFMAGYDATTSLLSYAIYNLTVNEKCQNRVVQEIESVLESHDIYEHARFSMIPTDTPFKLKILQFPIRLAFAITINKSQGQSLEMCGLDLDADCYSHGQLYVACSRVGKPDSLYIYADIGVTKNVYPQVLQN